MVIYLNKEEYLKLINNNKVKEPRLKNAIYSFLSGGLLGVICELLSFIITSIFKITKMDSYIYVCLILVILSTLFTALGFMDNYINKYKCGLIIPTTGFAHSVQSSTIDYKKEGLITGIGANYLKLAGSVILYGILSSVILLIIKEVMLCL